MSHRSAVLLMLLVTLTWSSAGVVTRHLDAARGFETRAWAFAGEHPGSAALIGGSLVLAALIANEALAPPPVKSVLKNA